MHDLIHDLAQSVAGNEFLILGNEGALNNPREIHHSSIHHGNLAQTRHASVICNFKASLIPETLYEAKKLRTLNVLSLRDDSGKALPTAIRVFKHLRVLDLSGSGIERLHNSIGGLIYLRYLDLSNTPVETLPETIGNLCNLQTLNLSGCSDLMKLPSGLTNLINLRHLNIKDCVKLTCMPGCIGQLRNLQTLPIFIVGHKEEGNLLNLKFLELRGELKIKHLENAGSIDIGSICIRLPANLLTHMQLYSLGLSWGNDDEGKLDRYSSRRTAGEYDCSNVEFVLSCLQPNCTLQRLSITEYLGNMFPQWMSNFMLPNLTELVLINCRRCKDLPTLGQLPFLKVLNMQGMDSVVNIDSKFYGEEERRSFPSLKELTLRDFPSLKSWESIDSKEAFTCLNRLCIINCPSLIMMPWFPFLQHLELQNCNTMILRSAAELNSLSTLVIGVFPNLFFLPKALLQNNSLLMSLKISSCPRLSSLPISLGNLTALKSLTIQWCEELDTLPHGLRNLTSLETLEIIECHSLISLPKESIEGLSSLRSFSIENCENLASLPMGMEHLRALEHLTIMYCLNLAHLPDGLQHLPALRSLTILSCPEFASLPEGLQHVKPLQNLEIRDCPNLKKLLECVENLISLRSLAISDCQNIKSLPEGLQHLSALQHLSIRNCPELERQCKEGSGENWHKISHIPHIYIGSPALQQKQDIATTSSSNS